MLEFWKSLRDAILGVDEEEEGPTCMADPPLSKQVEPQPPPDLEDDP